MRDGHFLVGDPDTDNCRAGASGASMPWDSPKLRLPQALPFLLKGQDPCRSPSSPCSVHVGVRPAVPWPSSFLFKP